MGIRLVRVNDFMRPAVFCDVCQRRIERGTNGNYLWRRNAPTQADVLFAHKECMPAFDAAGGQAYAAMELASFAGFLADGLEEDRP